MPFLLPLPFSALNINSSGTSVMLSDLHAKGLISPKERTHLLKLQTKLTRRCKAARAIADRAAGKDIRIAYRKYERKGKLKDILGAIHYLLSVYNYYHPSS